MPASRFHPASPNTTQPLLRSIGGWERNRCQTRPESSGRNGLAFESGCFLDRSRLRRWNTKRLSAGSSAFAEHLTELARHRGSLRCRNWRSPNMKNNGCRTPFDKRWDQFRRSRSVDWVDHTLQWCQSQGQQHRFVSECHRTRETGRRPDRPDGSN